MKAFTTYLVWVVFGTLSAAAQQLPEKGVPELHNYMPSEYGESGKIWDIDSAPNHIVYMASEKGLMEFDGKRWKNFTGSDGFTRSVYVVNDSLIYTGSDLDFGVWNRNEYLDFEYTSLYPFREDLTDISEEFWEIYRVGENMLFVSDYNIYVYGDGNLTKISAPEEFSGSYELNGTLYFADTENGLFRLSDLSLDQIADLPGDSEFEISGMYAHDEGTVVVTYNSGLYLLSSGTLVPLENELSRELEDSMVFSFEPVGENYLAFGTVQRGLFITDVDGRVIHHINRNKGLINNTILSTHFTRAGELWLGLDYGISSVQLHDNLTYVYDYRGDFGTGYAALLFDDQFYLGTNKGLYRSRWDALDNDSDSYSFTLVPGSEGQVWTLDNIDGDLLMGHDRGLFTIRGNSLERVSNEPGYWTLVPYKNVLLGGTYNGINVFERENNSWSFLKKIEQIIGSVNQLIVEYDNVVWVNIPNYGIIRMELDENLFPEKRKIFLDETFSGEDPYLVKSDERILVYTDSFEYSYSSADSSFTEMAIQRQSRLPDGSLSGTFQADQLNSEIEFLPVYNGFALRHNDDNGVASGEEPHEVLYRYMEAYNNRDRMRVMGEEEVPYAFNNIHVEYIVPNKESAMYQYRLGDDSDWSAWSSETEMDLVNMSYGDHRLAVRAVVGNDTTDAAIISFRIKPPWYLTWYAFTAYALLIVGGLYVMYILQYSFLKKQQEVLKKDQRQSLREQAEKHKREILLLEQDRLKSENDELEKQLKNKTIELANKAKENQDTNRILIKVKEKLESAQQKPEITASFWNEIHKLLDSYIHEEDNTFEIQMDELHQEFFQKLKKEYPELSSNELRLCAYLKLGFTSKEIADFSNIKPSSVYINRSRLRKKLNLDVEQDLEAFLSKI
ncbi:MAG: hypothetical protein R3283_07610 [Balneolaceae bacterium]|nr:hypothetical protein [Balneolaceae bacterium]